MTKEEVIKLANDFVSETYKRELPLLGCGKQDGEDVWSVHFRWETPDVTAFDGGILLIIDDKTGKIQYFDDWFNEEYQKGNMVIPPFKLNPKMAKRIQRRLERLKRDRKK
jgi:hypothetical protein